MPEPLVSIVTATYNQAQFLAQTIDSVLGQTYRHLDYIVLDDGSTDDTPRILERYRGREGIRIERHENQGQTATLNKGLAIARGDVLSWLNSDDWLTPKAVEEAVQALGAHPDALLIYGNCDNVDAAGSFHSHYPCHPETLESLVFFDSSIGIAQPSAFFRRRALDVAGFLDPAIYWCMDLDYWFRLGLHGPLVFVERPPWSMYRLHPAAKTSAQLARSAPDFVYVYRKLAAMAALPPELKNRRREIIAHGHWLAARRSYYGQAYKQAFREAVESLRLAPLQHVRSKLSLLARGARNWGQPRIG